MKKLLIFCISTFCIISGYAVINKASAQSVLRQSSVYNVDLTIPPSGNINNSMTVVSAISSLDQVLSNSEYNKIKGLTVVSARLRSGDQVKKNLGMFKSIKLYITMGDGLNEVLIASLSGVSKNTGSSLILDLDRGITDNSAGPDGTKTAAQLDPNSTSTNITEAILGKLPGVRVVPSPLPGGAPMVIIRGGASSLLSGGPPLFIVDGIAVDNLQSLNPKDVESVEVLKDAAETSMYGLRGASGVIIIKTKSGSPDYKKNAGSMDNFTEGSTIRVRMEYVLRYALRSATDLNVSINFKYALK
jgi:TonB-dependent SusC/RagA subfamily outer membrane receptor